MGAAIIMRPRPGLERSQSSLSNMILELRQAYIVQAENIAEAPAKDFAQSVTPPKTPDVEDAVKSVYAVPVDEGVVDKESSDKGLAQAEHIEWQSVDVEPNDQELIGADSVDEENADQDSSRLLSGPFLDIYVGPKRKHWSLHRNLLCYHSDFFDESKSVNGEVKHITDGKLELPQEDPAAFELLIKWLYQGHLEDVSNKPTSAKWDYAYKCQNLYILCQTLGLKELRNLAIDQFRKGCWEAGLVPGMEEMLPIYKMTPPRSPFRRLVSKIAARQIMDPDVKRDANTYHECFSADPEFAIDVINEIREGTGGFLLDDPTEGNSCRYHEHENGKSCHKTVSFDSGVKMSD